VSHFDYGIGFKGISIGEAADDVPTPNQRARMPPPSLWGVWGEGSGGFNIGTPSEADCAPSR
jgi:hypothetical protein